MTYMLHSCNELCRNIGRIFDHQYTTIVHVVTVHGTCHADVGHCILALGFDYSPKVFLLLTCTFCNSSIAGLLRARDSNKAFHPLITGLCNLNCLVSQPVHRTSVKYWDLSMNKLHHRKCDLFCATNLSINFSFCVKNSHWNAIHYILIFY